MMYFPSNATVARYLNRDASHKPRVPGQFERCLEFALVLLPQALHCQLPGFLSVGNLFVHFQNLTVLIRVSRGVGVFDGLSRRWVGIGNVALAV